MKSSNRWVTDSISLKHWPVKFAASGKRDFHTTYKENGHFAYKSNANSESYQIESLWNKKSALKPNSNHILHKKKSIQTELRGQDRQRQP